MNRSYKYTALSVLLALVFAFGSMAGMNLILHVRENQLLTEKGKAMVEVPVRSWQEAKSSMESFISGESMLTAKQMEEIIGRWDEHTIISHEPVNGQISMEEAIDAGKDWLVQMGMTEGGQKADRETYSASARLVTSLQEESMERQLEPYYSSWFVRFTGPTITAFLYMNAVTGTVWSADITLYEDLTEKVSYEKIYRFVEEAGLLAAGDMVQDQKETRTLLKIADSRLWAEMEIYHPMAQYSYTIYSEGGLNDYYVEAPDKNKVTYVFQFTLAG